MRGGFETEDFETLLGECVGAVERFVKFRLPSEFDADDVLQEVYIAAGANFDSLADKSCFKAWIIGIARNKCRDYYRKRAKQLEIPLETVSESSLDRGRAGITVTNVVRDTLSALADRDKEILYLYYFLETPQTEIARRYNIPLGTVKSRLHTAKANFKDKYPYPPKTKGDFHMTKLPEMMPEYTIIKSDEEPFAVKFEELSNWFIVPRINEKVSWASYDFPSKKKTEEVVSSVSGKVILHDVEGVEIKTTFLESGGAARDHYYMAQLTDTHCRWLGERYYDKAGVLHYLTFLDGDKFLEEWGFGDNNCGVETDLKAKGQIGQTPSGYTVLEKKHCLDVVGHCSVEIGKKLCQTVLAVEYFPDGALTEQYIGENGRTVLWRRFNRDDWKWKSNDYKKWSEVLPENEHLTVDGETYVHWYDCVADYIL